MGLELQDIDQQLVTTTSQLEKVRQQKNKVAASVNAVEQTDTLEELKTQIDQLVEQQNMQAMASNTLAELITKDSLEEDTQLFRTDKRKQLTQLPPVHCLY